MKITNKEFFDNYKKYGCFIDCLSYDFDFECDSYILTLIFDAYSSNYDPNQHIRIKLDLFSPTNISIKKFENRAQICELEMIDYSDDRYSSEMRYRLHDIEDEQLNIYFERYEINYLK